MLDNVKDSNYIWKTKLDDLKNIIVLDIFKSWHKKIIFQI